MSTHDQADDGPGTSGTGPAEAESKYSVPLRDQVFEQLETMIIERRLPPGSHLTEIDLAQILGVSRNPVREALSALSRSGWVDLRPRQGAFVRQPSDEEIRQFFHVRLILEVEAARLAAMRVSDEYLEELDRIVRMGSAASDEAELVSANAEFHGVVWNMGGNTLLAELLETQGKKLKWFFAAVAVIRAPASWKEHTEIYDALRAGDADWAASATERHCRATAAATATHRRLELWDADG